MDRDRPPVRPHRLVRQARRPGDLRDVLLKAAPRSLAAALAGGLAFAVLTPPVAARASPPEREGVVLYRKKCGGCHRPYAPGEIRPEKWEKVLPDMLVRAKLTPDEAGKIRRYVGPDLPASPAAEPAPR